MFFFQKQRYMFLLINYSSNRKNIKLIKTSFFYLIFLLLRIINTNNINICTTASIEKPKIKSYTKIKQEKPEAYSQAYLQDYVLCLNINKFTSKYANDQQFTIRMIQKI